MHMHPVLCMFIFGISFTEVLGADPKIKISPTFPETSTLNGYQTIVVNKDKDCFIPCVVSNRPKDKKTQWTFQDIKSQTLIPIATDTDTQNTFKYIIDKPAKNIWRLKIRNVQESDQGIYTCRIQLHGYSSAVGTRVLKVVETPLISDIETSSDITVNEGEKVELHCGASGIPTPVISWQLLSGGTLPTGGREYTAPVMVWSSVTRDHRGTYKCVAFNEAGKDERLIKLTVRFQPRVTARTPEVYQAVGHNRQLACEALGSPLPTSAQITWFKDGVLLEGGNRYTFETFMGSDSILMKLILSNINDGDFGQYRCYVENSEGAGQHFVELKRSETPISEYRGRSTASPTLIHTHVVILCLSFIAVFEILSQT